MNPLLYAGLSDNFRKSFRKVISLQRFGAGKIAIAGVPLWNLLAGSKPTATQLLLHNSEDSSGSTLHSCASGGLLLKNGGQGGPLHPRHLHVLEVPEQHRVWRNCKSKSDNYSYCQWTAGTSSSPSVKHCIPRDATSSVLSSSNTWWVIFDLRACPIKRISWNDFKFRYFG